jgi:hypothetical protein
MYLHGVNRGKFIHACTKLRNIFASIKVDTTTGRVGIDIVGTDTRLKAGKPMDLVSIRGGKNIFSSFFKKIYAHQSVHRESIFKNVPTR